MPNPRNLQLVALKEKRGTIAAVRTEPKPSLAIRPEGSYSDAYLDRGVGAKDPVPRASQAVRLLRQGHPEWPCRFTLGLRAVA